MKNFYLLWLIVLFISGARQLTAQTSLTEYYTFEKGFGKYQVIDTTAMQSISGGDIWVEDDVYKVPIPFKFRFLDHNLTYLKTNQTNVFLPERNYFIATFGNFLMWDFGNKDSLKKNQKSLSPISYIIDSSSGSKIMKIQWIDAGYFFDSTMYINIQVWLYEKTNNIEIRYGKSNVNLKYSQVSGCGPLIGIVKADTVAQIDKYELLLRANSSNPQPVGIGMSGKRCLNDVPPEGTIYKFVFHDSAKVVDQYAHDYNIYPNPTHGFLKVDLPGPGPYTIEVLDMYGHSILNSPIKYGQNLDLSHLSNGLYVVKIAEEAVVYTQKVMLDRK